MNRPNFIAKLIATASLLAFGAISQAAVVIQAEHDNYLPGEPIGFAFSGGPGNKKDWIGVYSQDVTPGSVASTIWNYVDGTQSGNTAFKAGTVNFPGGLTGVRTYDAHFLLNDGYTSLAKTTFNVVEEGTPVVRVGARTFTPNQAISISFTNGPGNAKDWVAVYKEGEVPGAVGSTIWQYVDGGSGVQAGISETTLTFPAGLSQTGSYVAYLLENDSYTPLASESFTVALPETPNPVVVAVDPADGAVGAPITPVYSAKIRNGTALVKLDTISLKLDGKAVSRQVSSNASVISVTFESNTLLASGSQHLFTLVFQDTAGTKATNEVHFSALVYQDIQLPAPLYLETFETAAEGGLPNGWSQTNHTEVLNESLDLGDLNSASYATWVTVSSDRFEGSFTTYSDPSRAQSEKDDYKRVLTPGAASVVNGVNITRLATGNFLFANSGYRNGRSQVMEVYTPDYDLTGKKNVRLSFHSLLEQNQDSIASVEYSVDRGASWLPVVYYLAPSNILKDDTDAVDAVATFTTGHGDAPVYTDSDGNDVGGNYGAFIAAPITPALALSITARRDDDPADGKRVELFGLSAAENQPAVRFRLGQAGSDSWYFGVDDFGIYADNIVSSAPKLSINAADQNITIRWTSAPAFALESSPTGLPGTWTVIPVADGATQVTLPFEGSTRFFRMEAVR